MTQEYSEYFIDVTDYTLIDIYRYLELLPGHRGHAIEHALKKLALCGVRTGGKDIRKDIKEARDTLTRWLDMRNEDDAIALRESLERNPEAQKHEAVGRAYKANLEVSEQLKGIHRLVTESMNGVPTKPCWCEFCDVRSSAGALKGLVTRMSVCPACGDKRCSKAAHHDNKCSAAEACAPIESCMELTGVELEGWASYVATDRDGRRFQYELNPVHMPDGRWQPSVRRSKSKLIDIAKPPLNFIKTLIKLKD